MNDVFRKTLGGLCRAYHLRQLFFGSLFLALICVVTLHGSYKTMWPMLAYATICTLLYPYSRFVYESVVSYIVGENVFFVTAIVMLMTRCLTMSLCWVFSPFVAPIGLLYLYWHHTKLGR